MSRRSLNPNPPMVQGWTARTAEGGEGVTVRIRLAGGLQALLGAPMAAYSGCGERDGGIGHWQEALAELVGASWRGRWVSGGGRRQAGSGMARSRARARNWVSQGQRCGRCRVIRRAERVRRPARAKTRRLRVLVVLLTQADAGCPAGQVESPVPPARLRWRRSGRTACGSVRHRIEVA